MTNHWIDIKNADAVLIMGSNAAEHHPVSFKWIMRAKDAGAALMHVDPKFSRTSARCDFHVPIRSGTDIATDVWGAGARLRISGYAGTRAEESPSAAAQTGLPVSLHGARTAKADCRSNRDGCRIDRYSFRAYEGR